MSAGFLPVSLGMLPGLFFGTVVRRLRRSSAFVLAPTGEWGTDLAPGDLALWDAAVTVVALLGGLGFAWCVVALVRAGKGPTPRIVFSHGDIARYVRERDPRLTPREAEAFADAIAFDADAPPFGQDWSEWLERNHDRILLRAAQSLECEP